MEDIKTNRYMIIWRTFCMKLRAHIRLWGTHYRQLYHLNHNWCLFEWNLRKVGCVLKSMRILNCLLRKLKQFLKCWCRWVTTPSKYVGWIWSSSWKGSTLRFENDRSFVCLFFFGLGDKQVLVCLNEIEFSDTQLVTSVLSC